ncbi:hypothetical protein HMPREF1421_00374 [Helicobacter pylori GAM265BSii]|uniref:Uncharacterized protein n=1 Tax=Helicobacter pylori GAM265BSii TaxID=1159049 RepID=M3NPC4_HELPX|nr:hypothetical protein HMPREF1402_00314 [Helicobacter pylori GAM121Aii]EMH30084.1 hypothetical protein HMPREF1421_00374 [Helicobacter pylori GAM265BSii]
MDNVRIVNLCFNIVFCFHSFSLHSQRFKPLFCFVVVFVVTFLKTSL